MKILCLNFEYPPVGGGGATVCRSIAEALADMGHEVDIVTSGMKDLAEQEVVGGVTVHRVRCVRRRRYYSTAPELLTQILPSYRKALELAQTRNYDVNHTHFIVPSGIVAYLLKKKTGLPYVVTAHGSDIPGYNPDRFELTHKLIRPVWRSVIRHSDAITSPSYYMQELIQAQIDWPVTVIPNAYTPTFDEIPNKANRILVASRLVERKGIQFLIEASDALGDGWEVWIAGDGPYLPALRELADRVSTPIRFLGFLPREELLDLYLSSQIFVFPSTQENFPMVLLEAMAAGCATITTTAKGCVEVVGDAAVKVPPADVGALRGALVAMTGNTATIDRYRQLGCERVKQFSSRQVAAQLIELFERIAS